MSTTTVVSLRQPDEIDDPLTAVLRSGARRLLAQAVEAEAEAFLAEMRGERLADGRERVVRHGHGPERLVQTGIGPGAFAARNAEVAVQRVKLRGRAAGEAGAERIRFTSAILPRWARRTRSLDALLPVLYLRGVSMSGEPLGSTGDFQEALGTLLGRDAPNLPPSVVARHDTQPVAALLDRAAQGGWTIERVKVDGIYIGPRMTQAAQDHGVDVQVTTRDADAKGFKPLPLRWRIEATFGTLANRWHRLTRNLEQSPAAAEDGVAIANCHRLLRAYHRPEYIVA